MEQLASDTCTNRRVTGLVGSGGGGGGLVFRVCQLVCQAAAVAQFYVHVSLQLLKMKSLQ